MVLLIRGHWEEIKPQMQLGSIYTPRTVGPTLAANSAKPYLNLPDEGKSCQLGTPAREAVLVQVAAITIWGSVAKGSEPALLNFYNYLFAGIDKRMGFSSPGQLMEASVPYIGDLVEQDLYAVAQRASNTIDPTNENLSSILWNAFFALQIWPLFFQNLTLKKPLFG